jgi:hypothetical protein
VAALDPWDDILEAATGALNGLVGGSRTGSFRLSAPAWDVEMRAHRRDVVVQFVAKSPPVQLDDYRLAVLYGCSLRPLGDLGSLRGFGKSLQVKAPHTWDEQMLREVVLEAVGLLRYILGAEDRSTVSASDNTRAVSPLLARARGRRRN